MNKPKSEPKTARKPATEPPPAARTEPAPAPVEAVAAEVVAAPPQLPEQAGSKTADAVTLFGLWAEPGAGWRWAKVAVPRSYVQSFVEKVSEPDLLVITQGNMMRALDEHLRGAGRE